jgi:hypothetical protein
MRSDRGADNTAKLIKALVLLTEAKTMAAVWPHFIGFGERKREYIQHVLFWNPNSLRISADPLRFGWGKKGKKVVLHGKTTL